MSFYYVHEHEHDTPFSDNGFLGAYLSVKTVNVFFVMALFFLALYCFKVLCCRGCSFFCHWRVA